MDIREIAEDLRSRAATVREEIAAQRDELERRAAEAAALEAQARQLDAEQDHLDAVAALEREADEEESAAAELDAQVERLDTNMVDAAVRAARFADQLGSELVERRRALDERADAAAEAGDADVLVDVEREIAALPAVEQRLREQAEAARSDAIERNENAARLESMADYRRRRAAVIRRRARGEDVVDRERLPDDDLRQWGAPNAAAFSLARTRALETVLAASDLARGLKHFAAALERERFSAIQADRRARWIALLDRVNAQIEPVAEAAIALGAPSTVAPNLTEGTLDWYDGRDRAGFKVRDFRDARQDLAGAVAHYEESISVEAMYHRAGEWPPPPVPVSLSACETLAAVTFQLASEVVVAADAAATEIEQAREGFVIAARKRTL